MPHASQMIGMRPEAPRFGVGVLVAVVVVVVAAVVVVASSAK